MIFLSLNHMLSQGHFFLVILCICDQHLYIIIIIIIIYYDLGEEKRRRRMEEEDLSLRFEIVDFVFAYLLFPFPVQTLTIKSRQLYIFNFFLTL